MPEGTGLADLRVEMDGADVTTSARGAGDTVTVTPPETLADGLHDVSVSFGGDDLLARTVARAWRFAADTTAPDLAVSAPRTREQITETDEPLVQGELGTDDPRGPTSTASVNGDVVATVRGSDTAGPDDYALDYGDASSTPGPGNPLGPRSIGSTAPAIGIHGTYADDSIGTAASHGCMRMHIPEAEELYERSRWA